jgi:hypothetical protein
MTTIIDTLDNNTTTPVKSKLPLNVVFADIKKYNAQNSSTYRTNDISKAEKVKLLCEWAFPRSRTFVTYRSKFIAVKVEDVTITDAIPVHMNMLNEMIANDDKINIVAAGEHLIFRISRS